jgi:hypothetical protein
VATTTSDFRLLKAGQKKMTGLSFFGLRFKNPRSNKPHTRRGRKFPDGSRAGQSGTFMGL